MFTTVNARDVPAKAIFERLYLVSGRRTFALSINCPCSSTPSTAQSWLILDFKKFTIKVGLGISQTNGILSGIQLTTHFIEIFDVETKRFVGSTVILTRQTCGQRSSRAAESKTPSVRKLFFRANLLYVPNIKM
jgi:hypothetical protein